MKNTKHILLYTILAVSFLSINLVVLSLARRLTVLESPKSEVQKTLKTSHVTDSRDAQMIEAMTAFYAKNPPKNIANKLVKVAASAPANFQGSVVKVKVAAYNYFDTSRLLFRGEYPRMSIMIDGQVVSVHDILAKQMSYDTTGGELQEITYYSPRKLSPEQVRIGFDNDVWEIMWDPSMSFSTDLYVHSLQIDSATYTPASDASTSTGTWTANGCGNPAPGKHTGWLHCSGYFAFTKGSIMKSEPPSIPGDDFAPTAAPDDGVIAPTAAP